MNEFDDKQVEKLPEDDTYGQTGEIFRVQIPQKSDEEDDTDEMIEACEESAEPAPSEDTTKSSDKLFLMNAVDWICSIVFSGAVVVFINLFLFRAISVDGTSMCNTLQDGDVVITLSPLIKPSFGDIVVVRSDKLVNSDTGLYGEPIIKRVIGLEGDTIRFDLEKGEVYRNGELLSEDYIIGPTDQKYNGWVESETDYVVPENCVFILGDNRKISHDSRDLKLIGFVDENYIMGKAIFRIFPLSEMKWL